MSEALIIESVNPQYDERLFIELQEKYKLRTCVILNVKSKNLVHNMFWAYGLTDARMRASEKNLPVH